MHDGHSSWPQVITPSLSQSSSTTTVSVSLRLVGQWLAFDRLTLGTRSDSEDEPIFTPVRGNSCARYSRYASAASEATLKSVVESLHHHHPHHHPQAIAVAAPSPRTARPRARGGAQRPSAT